MKVPRWVRIALSLLVVPVVVFSNPTMAGAAAPWVEVNTDGGGVKCWTAVQQTPGGSANLVTGGYCIGGTDQPGAGDAGESGSAYTVTLSGITGGGGSCVGFVQGTLGDHSSNGFNHVAGSFGGQSVSVGPDCTITRVCVRSGSDGGTWYGDTYTDSCATTSIAPDNTPDPGAPCLHGTPGTGVQLVYKEVPHPTQTTQKIQSWTAKFFISRPVISTAQWAVRIRNHLGYQGAVVPMNGEVEFGNRIVPNTWAVWEMPANVGFQLYATPDPWNNVYQDANSGIDPTASQVLNPGLNIPYMGTTVRVHCRFYIGPKVLDVPGTTADDPHGNWSTTELPPENPPPTPPEPPVDPDEGTNWLYAIWLVLKGIAVTLMNLAGSIASAITGALGSLVDAVLDGIESLFVPDEGFMDDAFGDVRADWEDTSLTKWSDALSDITPGSASGCGGIPVSVTLPGGVPISEHVGAACTGPLATAASVVRACLTAMLVIGGAFACMRGIGAGFGWQPSIGRGED